MTLAERRGALQLGGPANLHRTWEILAGGAEDCAAALIEIATTGRTEPSRVMAARAVLGMVGFNSPETVAILPPQYDAAATPAAVGDSPTARIRSRMAALAASSSAQADAEAADAELVIVDDEGHEVVEAVIVDE